MEKRNQLCHNDYPPLPSNNGFFKTLRIIFFIGVSTVVSGALPSLATAQNQSSLCNYAGYLTVKHKNKCIKPWVKDWGKRNILKKTLRSSNLGHLRIKYDLCGSNVHVRCNPILYGFRSHHPEKECPSSTGDKGDNSNESCCEAGKKDSDSDKNILGCCVRTTKFDHKTTTESCNKALAFDDNHLNEFVNSLSDDPIRLAEYLSYAINIIKNCDQSECDKLKEVIETPLREITNHIFRECDRSINLLRIPELSQIDEILTFLDSEDEDKERLLDIRDDLIEDTKSKKTLLENIMEDYLNDPRTSNMIKVAEADVKCDTRTPEQRKKTNETNEEELEAWKREIAEYERRNKKPPTKCRREKETYKSTRYCARHVLNALSGIHLQRVEGVKIPKADVSDEEPYFPSRLNVHGKDVKNEILKNSDEWMDIRKCPFGPQYAENAPRGAILVYKGPEGHPGHTEIAKGNNQFISDFTTDYRSPRHLIGIMIHVRDENQRNELINDCPDSQLPTPN